MHVRAVLSVDDAYFRQFSLPVFSGADSMADMSHAWVGKRLLPACFPGVFTSAERSGTLKGSYLALTSFTLFR